MYTVSNNTPSAGYIQWANVHIQYQGNSYTVDNGYTNYKYVYWLSSSPITFVVSDTFPSLGASDVLVFLNKSGIALVVPTATVLDGGLIVPGTILADAIAANAITSSKIVADAVTATQLATGCVTADAVAANAIGANAIAAAAITADKLVADSITAREIASRTITANEIVAGTITANEIAASTITAAKMVAGTITAASGIIADAAITNAKIATVDAAKITTGALDAARISAGSILASHLDVRAKQLVNDHSRTGNLTGWTNTGSLAIDATKGNYAHEITTTGDVQILSDYFEVDPNKTYKATLSVKTASVGGTRYFGMHAVDKDGANLNVTPFIVATKAWGTASNNFYFWSKTGAQSTWLDMEVYIVGCNVDLAYVPLGKNAANMVKLPSNAHRVRLRYLNYGNAGASSTAYFWAPTVTEVDAGAIRASQIQVGKISSTDGKTYFDLDNSIIQQTATVGTKTATLKINPTEGLAFYDGASKVGGVDAVSGNLAFMTMGSGLNGEKHRMSMNKWALSWDHTGYPPADQNAWIDGGYISVLDCAVMSYGPYESDVSEDSALIIEAQSGNIVMCAHELPLYQSRYYPSYGYANSFFGGINVESGPLKVAGNMVWHAGNDSTLVKTDRSNQMIMGNNEFYSDDAAGSPYSSAIELREVGLVGANQYIDSYAPRLGFHWAGRVAGSLMLNYLGNLCWDNGSISPLWHGTNFYIESGAVCLNSNTATRMTFGRYFPSAPVVFFCPVTNTAGVITAKITNLTNTCVDAIIGGPGYTEWFHWVALLYA